MKQKVQDRFKKERKFCELRLLSSLARMEVRDFLTYLYYSNSTMTNKICVLCILIFNWLEKKNQVTEEHI